MNRLAFAILLGPGRKKSIRKPCLELSSRTPAEKQSRIVFSFEKVCCRECRNPEGLFRL